MSFSSTSQIPHAGNKLQLNPVPVSTRHLQNILSGGSLDLLQRILEKHPKDINYEVKPYTSNILNINFKHVNCCEDDRHPIPFGNVSHEERYKQTTSLNTASDIAVSISTQQFHSIRLFPSATNRGVATQRSKFGCMIIQLTDPSAAAEYARKNVNRDPPWV